jgi:hypothetical protein
MMPILSHQNHFKFGYDTDFFIPRKNPEQKWVVQYGPCTKIPLNFKEECIRTAQTIYRDAGSKKINLLFSGGSDSEVVLQSFALAEIPFSVSILRFENDLNIHDISYAIIACEKWCIPYKLIDLNLLSFWENNITKYADPTYCISPQLISTMWLVDQIEGFPVMGSGECLLVKDYPADYIPGVSPYEHSEWYLWEREKIAAWYRHFIVRGRSGCPGFFQYTPEIILSYLQDPFVQRLTNSQIAGKLSTESSKLKIYQQHFELIDRPKYSGFERVPDQDAYFRRILTERYPHANSIFKTSVNQLLTELPPKL